MNLDEHRLHQMSFPSPWERGGVRLELRSSLGLFFIYFPRVPLRTCLGGSGVVTLDAGILDGTVGIINLLADGRNRGIECALAHAVDTELYAVAYRQLAEVFLISGEDRASGCPCR